MRVPTAHLNRLEIAFLFLIDFSILVTPKEYFEFEAALAPALIANAVVGRNK